MNRWLSSQDKDYCEQAAPSSVTLQRGLNFDCGWATCSVVYICTIEVASEAMEEQKEEEEEEGKEGERVEQKEEEGKEEGEA